MKFIDGKELVGVSYKEITDHLRSCERKKITTAPDELQICNDGKNLFLQHYNGTVKEYPLRKSFAYKLLKWHFFPVKKLHILTIDTITSLFNDLLLGIRSRNVNITIEKNEALTITSDNYNELPDLQVLEMVKDAGVAKVSRNDFFMRIYTRDKMKIEPFVNDEFGVGMNIINSETGFRALTVSNFLLRLVCTNGMVAHTNRSEHKLFHYGHEKGKLEEFLVERMAAVSESKDMLENKLQASAIVLKDEELKNLKTKVQRLIGASDAKFIFSQLDESSTKYDYVNALTSFAKGLKIGKRLMVEEFAGRLIMN